jgi:type II secretory pathway pseudopilin PulG
MPGSTANEHLPYPFVTETVNAASQQNLATAIEASLASLDALRLDALKPPTTMPFRFGSVAITVNTDTAANLTSSNFNDPTSMHNNGVNPDQVILPTNGIYLVHGEANLTATTTLTAVKVAITQNGTQIFAQQTSPKSSTTGWIMDTDGVVIGQAGDIIRLSGRWSGTGTGGFAGCFLHVTRLCYLV